jgi:hypothetical protein
MPLLHRLLLAALLAASATIAGAAALRVEPSTGPNEWSIFHGSQKLLVYAFSPTKFKPYVKELYTLKGQNLLRDAPHDHLHHHALMYAIKVNGLNFWEEISGSGVEKVVQSPPPELGTSPTGLPQARITQVIHWVAPQDAFLPDSASLALLVERRTLTLTVNEAEQEVALQWKGEFEVGAKTNQVTLTGSTYFGLGVRFPQELDPLAAHLNQGGKPDLNDNKQDVSQHAWGSVSFAVPGKPATLAIFGHPGNPAGQARYFTMRTPFAYLSATQGLDQQPLVYRPGERWTVNYLVALYPEVKTKASLDQRAQQWQASKP